MEPESISNFNRLNQGVRRFFIGAAALMVCATGTLMISPGNAGAPDVAEFRRIKDPVREQGLSLGFAEVSGAFLGDVQLVIEDRDGTPVVDTVVDGPWFFAPLPAGSYHVRAVFDDQIKQVKDVQLAKNQGTRMVLYWDLSVPATQMMASASQAKESL
jgi:hypothetical protein